MRMKTRKIIIIISLLLFPVTMNFLSPYVSIDGAMNGIIAGSVLFFIILFLSAIFFGRAWCSWGCPIAALCDYSSSINNKKVNVRKLRKIRLTVFAIWGSILIAMFILSGGIKQINPLYLTENGISVDQPLKYIFYYLVLAIFLVSTIKIGRRGACHSFCWMSPFLEAGYKVGKLIKIPQIRIKMEKSRCVGCGACDAKCPMSIEVSQSIGDGYIETADCILCGECIDSCKKGVFAYSVKGRKKQALKTIVENK